MEKFRFDEFEEKEKQKPSKKIRKAETLSFKQRDAIIRREITSYESIKEDYISRGYSLESACAMAAKTILERG